MMEVPFSVGGRWPCTCFVLKCICSAGNAKITSRTWDAAALPLGAGADTSRSRDGNWSMAVTKIMNINY